MLDVTPAQKTLVDVPPAPAIEQAFREFILEPSFPCVAAKAAINGDVCTVSVYDELASDRATERLSEDLFSFIQADCAADSDYRTFAAIFRTPVELAEREFEALLWQQLKQLNARDAEQFAWDPSVSADPDDPHFGFSFAEHAFYIVGLHARSSRDARRFPWPTLVFNFHAQFERLRAKGKWERMQHTIRDRDERLQGSINPMINDFGVSSEARQYSGRAVGEDWHAPFEAETPKCPFHP